MAHLTPQQEAEALKTWACHLYVTGERVKVDQGVLLMILRALEVPPSTVPAIEGEIPVPGHSALRPPEGVSEDVKAKLERAGYVSTNPLVESRAE